LRVELIDVFQQFDERLGAVIDQTRALVGACKRCITDCAAGMQVLRLPCKGRGPMRGKAAILPLHGDARGTKIPKSLGAYMLLVSCQHDRGLNGAAMYAVA